jgi:hypothetical protein
MIKNRVSWCKITIEVGIATASILSVVQPANALLFNSFEFTDQFGTEGSNGTITGIIGFESLSPNHSGTDTVAATSLVINSIPSYFETLWTDDLTFAVGKNIVGAGNDADPSFTRTYDYFDNNYIPSNSFTVTNGLITNFKFEERYYLGTPDISNPSLNEQYEWVVLGGAANENSVEDLITYPDGFPGNWLEITYPDRFVYDIDSITFAAVPFEFSPGFGLLTMGGIWGISRLHKFKVNRNTLN